MKFEELLTRTRGGGFIPPFRLLALDPGHTTGWSIFEDGKLTLSGQAATEANGWEEIHGLFEWAAPTMVIYENYRVYEHKLARHANSEVYTLRLIGVIEYLCDIVHKIPKYNQMALQHKGFCSDDKLKSWGYYDLGHKHARDSIRAGTYFLLFNKEAFK
ncbi:hypothetical protein D3C71_449010 [compost metagenome]